MDRCKVVSNKSAIYDSSPPFFAYKADEIAEFARQNLPLLKEISLAFNFVHYPETHDKLNSFIDELEAIVEESDGE